MFLFLLLLFFCLFLFCFVFVLLLLLLSGFLMFLLYFINLRPIRREIIVFNLSTLINAESLTTHHRKLHRLVGVKQKFSS